MWGFLGAIGSWISGGSKTADTVINDVSSGIDKLVYTDQEKSEAGMKGFELLIKYQEATLPQNVARRQLALIMLVWWLLIGTLVVIGIVLHTSWKAELFDFFKSISPYIGAVWGFYFVKRFISDKPNGRS